MNLKNAAFLALVGTVMLTVLLIAGFIFDVLNVLRGLIPATRLLTSFIYAVAGLSAVVFLYAFHKGAVVIREGFIAVRRASETDYDAHVAGGNRYGRVRVRRG